MESLERLNISRKAWRDKNVLVTGGAGFLGGWLVDALVDLGANVVCVIRDKVPQSHFFQTRLDNRSSIVHGDINDYLLLERTMAEYEVEIVLHMAAQALVTVAENDPFSTFESNIKGTWTVLEACRRNPTVKRIVVASSDKAYGEMGKASYREDTALLGAEFPYDVSKACADLIAQSYFKTYKLPVAITRCGNLFGGGDLNFNRIIPGTIRSALRGERPILRSSGKYLRDYFYVKDAVSAILKLAENMKKKQFHGEAFNFSSNTNKTVLQIVGELMDITNKNLKPIILNKAEHEIKRQSLSTGKAQKHLKWKPVFNFRQALEETVQWYREFL
ncbi:NAD-dependent epimerase/dehydratase family protein [Elusimicrobiota bacterium]